MHSIFSNPLAVPVMIGGVTYLVSGGVIKIKAGRIKFRGRGPRRLG